MLEKRRYFVGFPTSPLIATLLSALFCFTIWHISLCPQVTESRFPVPSYLLLLPGNASALPPPYPVSRLPSWDLSTLIDLPEFEFQINNFPCNDTATVLLVLLVHSAPANREKRQVIRETWGRKHDSYNVLFLLGGVLAPDLQLEVTSENRIYHDIIQGSFQDNYRNMTYKHVMALKWTTYYCPNARYLLKTDDDVFVNTYSLLDFLSQELSPWGARKLMLCKPFDVPQVKRSFRSKWRVSPREYPGRFYPKYCAGWAILYSPDVVFLLYKEAQRSEYFWIDDVHVTGTLAARVNLTQTPLGSLILSREQVDNLIGEASLGSSFGIDYQFLFGPPDLSLTDITRLWQVIQESRFPQRRLTPSS